LADDAAADLDGDGLSNLQEYLNDTVPGDKDTDDDGLGDRDEVVRYCTNPLNRDTDHDGQNDGDEVFARTDPLNSESLFRIVTVVYTPQGAAVLWSAVSRRTYQCHFSTDLRAWKPLGGPVTSRPNDPFLSFFDWECTSSTARYYRIEVTE
jgi:hypothetical protein